MADGSQNHVLSMFNILYNHHKNSSILTKYGHSLIIVNTVHLPSRGRARLRALGSVDAIGRAAAETTEGHVMSTRMCVWFGVPKRHVRSDTNTLTVQG